MTFLHSLEKQEPGTSQAVIPAPPSTHCMMKESGFNLSGAVSFLCSCSDAFLLLSSLECFAQGKYLSRALQMQNTRAVWHAAAAA